MKIPKYMSAHSAELMRANGVDVPACLVDPADREYHGDGGEKFLLTLELRSSDDERVYATSCDFYARDPYFGVGSETLSWASDLLATLGKYNRAIALARILCMSGVAWARPFVGGETDAE